MAIYLVYLYLLHAQSFTRFQGLLQNKKDFFLSFLENLADTKRKFIDVVHFSTLHFLLFMTLSTFYDYVSHGPFLTGVSAACNILEAD